MMLFFNIMKAYVDFLKNIKVIHVHYRKLYKL